MKRFEYIITTILVVAIGVSLFVFIIRPWLEPLWAALRVVEGW